LSSGVLAVDRSLVLQRANDAAGGILGGISHISGALGGALIIVIIPTIFESWTEEASLGVATYLPGIIVSALLLLSIALAPEGPSELLHKIRHRHRH
ncbi:MAG: hypothetical protein EBR76_04140, partial [Actinobacteria bacterium]|nr:hypothetical protein [Actinomycetota bacterium]